MSDTISTVTDAELLSRVVVPTESDLSPDAARALLQLRFPQPDVDRMNELAQKNQLGTLSSDEQSEMEAYTRVGNLINLLKAKAQRSLQTDPAG